MYMLLILENRLAVMVEYDQERKKEIDKERKKERKQTKKKEK